jgi:hypothetical protein
MLGPPMAPVLDAMDAIRSRNRSTQKTPLREEPGKRVLEARDKGDEIAPPEPMWPLAETQRKTAELAGLRAGI